MKDMKLIMEGWRHFSENQEENTIFLFENSLPRKTSFDLITEERKLEEVLDLWEVSSNYEYEQLLTEIKALDKAKEFVSDISNKVNDFILKLSIQAFTLLQKGAKAVKKVMSIIKKILGGINKYCQKLPTICKIAKFTAVVLILFAISALFLSTDANAAIQIGKEPLDDSTYNYLRGYLMDLIQDPDILDMKKKAGIVDIVDQLDTLQKSPDITKYNDLAPDLKKALDLGIEQHEFIADMVEKGDLTIGQASRVQDYMEKLGESASATIEVFEWESPTGSGAKYSMEFSAAKDLPKHPYR